MGAYYAQVVYAQVSCVHVRKVLLYDMFLCWHPSYRPIEKRSQASIRWFGLYGESVSCRTKSYNNRFRTERKVESTRWLRRIVGAMRPIWRLRKSICATPRLRELRWTYCRTHCWYQCIGREDEEYLERNRSTWSPRYVC